MARRTPQTQVPQLTAANTHGQDGRGKFIQVEMMNETTFESQRVRAYFNKVDLPRDFKPVFYHIEQPIDYYDRHPFEAQQIKPPSVKLPPGISYAKLSDEDKSKLPHMNIDKGILPMQTDEPEEAEEEEPQPQGAAAAAGTLKKKKTRSKSRQRVKQLTEQTQQMSLYDLLDIPKDFIWLMIELHLVRVHPLGTGNTGIYYLCRKDVESADSKVRAEYADDVKRIETVRDANNNAVVVLKIYIITDMWRCEQMDRVYEETLAHAELKHPNVVNTYAVRFRGRHGDQQNGVINIISKNTDIRSHIIMEYSEVGSFNMLGKKLFHHVKDFSYYLLYLQDVVQGLAYLHSTGRAHREISDGNFLAVEETADRLKKAKGKTQPGIANSTIKLCDFAFTRRFADKRLLRHWQSMDVLDVGRMILGHANRWLQERRDQELRKEVEEVAKFLMVDSVDKRLDNFGKLVMKPADRSKDVRAFFKQAVKTGGGRR